MVWFKVDDSFDMHPKVLAAGNTAIGLWVRCGSYASKHLTDGYVPGAVALLFAGGDTASVEHLLSSGLWDAVEGGFQMHDFTEYNPPREKTEEERRRKAENQRLYQERKRRERENREITREADRSSDRSLTMYRPDPTRPDPSSSNEEEAVVGSPRTTRAKKAHLLPKTWTPTDEHRSYAAKHGLDVDKEAAQFRDHHALKGTLGKDWNAGFRNWLSRAVEYRDERLARPGTSTQAAARVDWMNL